MVDTRAFFTISTYMKYATIPSTVILILLALLQRRRKPHKCGYHHPALIVPMRFLDGYRDRWAYALSFGAITSILFSIFFQAAMPSGGDSLFCPDADANSTISSACNQTWVKTLQLQGQSLIASLVCAPHFACITTGYRMVGALLGFAYSVFWIVFYVVGAVHSEEDLGRTYGSFFLVRDIPTILCFAGLCIRSVWVIYRCYVTKSVTAREIEYIVEDHQVKHVVALFQKPEPAPMPPEDFKEKIVSKLKPTIFPHFRLPARIICIAFVQILSVYYIGVSWTGLGLVVRDSLTYLADAYIAGPNSTVEIQPLLNIFTGTFVTAEVIGLASSVIYIMLFVNNYRYNMIKIYKGKKDEYLEGPQSTSEHVARSLRLPGYQIAYILWGFIIIFAVVFFILAIICYGIYVLQKVGMMLKALSSIAQTLSVPVMTIIIFYFQVLLVRAFLLQPKINKEDEHRPLNVDNRHLYEVVSYVLVFSNLLVGLASALFRTLKSFILGVIFLGRLDRCLLMKGFEQMDPGYMAYIGTLLVDNAHNNPVMRTFCAVLYSLRCKEDLDKEEKGIQRLPQPTKLCSNSRAARRWHLAYTLVHNPDLLPRRKLALLLTRGLEGEEEGVQDPSGSTTSKRVENGTKLPAPTPSRQSSRDDRGSAGKGDRVSVRSGGSGGSGAGGLPPGDLDKKLRVFPGKRGNYVQPEVGKEAAEEADVMDVTDSASAHSFTALVPESPTRFDVDQSNTRQSSAFSKKAYV